jgi:hypothetical protein
MGLGMLAHEVGERPHQPADDMLFEAAEREMALQGLRVGDPAGEDGVRRLDGLDEKRIGEGGRLRRDVRASEIVR